MDAMNEQKPMATRPKLTIDYRIVVVLLLLIIAGMVAMWRPWEGAKDRTIQVTGQATVKATPDEYVFSPSYDFTDTNKDTALAALTKKSNDIIAKLKSLGVPDSGIKNNADSYSYPIYSKDDATATYTLRLAVTVGNKDLAQKVQDYLVTTTPSGSITPQAEFSDTMRNQLESQARDLATKDARSKADQSAKNLGFHVGGVKSVDDGTGFGGIIRPFGVAQANDKASQPSLTIQPGENDLSYTVTVEYFIQ